MKNDLEKLRKILIGKTLTNICMVNDELHLEVDDGITLRVLVDDEEIYTELSRKVISYEPLRSFEFKD